MQTATFEQVNQQVERQKAVALPRSASASVSPKALKVNKDKLKELWPTIKLVLTFLRPIVPKKWKAAIDSFIAVADIVIMGTSEE